MNTPASPLTGQQPNAAPLTSGTPSVWKDVVMGAIYGLAGSKGATHFGAGAAGGAAGVVDERQKEFENTQQQNRLQMESVQAADTHVRALDEHRRADQLDAESKLDYKAKSASYQALLQDAFGITPDLSFNDTHADATAGLTTMANQNGGTIPPVATVQQPSPDGEHGQIAVYSPSQQKFQQNMQGYRKLIDTARAIQGLPPVDDASFNSIGFKGARDQANAAIEFIKPTPAFSLDKSSPNYLPNVLAQKKQQLAQYQEHTDINGGKDADPAVVKQLQNGIDYLQSSWSTTQKQEADQAAAVTTAQEEAKKPFVEAEHKFQQGLAQQTAEFNRKGADQNTRALKADELITTEANDRDKDLKNITDLKSNLAQVDAGNQAATKAFQVKFAEHEIVEGGVKRLNQTELEALTTGLGDYGRQFQAWIDAGRKGNMPAATKAEMLQILNAEAKSRNDLYDSHVNNINQNLLKQAPAAPSRPKGVPENATWNAEARQWQIK